MYRHLVSAVGRRLKQLLLAIFLIVFLIIAGTGVYAQMPYGGIDTLSPAKVLFLEHSMIANGTVISGEVPFRSVDFPNYWFNENTRQLNGNIDFPLNDSLLLIFGDALTLRGNFGAGTGNKLYGVYSIPIKANGATIFSIDPYGTIGLNVNNSQIFLRPGEEYRYNQTEKTSEGKGVVQVNYEHTYTNRGIISKNAITTRMVP